MAETPDYRSIAREIRRRTLVCIGSIGQGHIGGSLSVAEILAVLYYGKMRVRPEEPSWPDRDILVLSKGHAGPALYSVLTMKGYFPEDWLKTLNKPETLLPSHCDMRRTPGVDMTTGSLGQGASAACGFALAQKMDGRDARTFAILGDGEMEEGEVWESFLFASQKKLSNLCVFVDFNNLQIDGTVDEICSLGDLCAKFRSFGFGAYEVDGHDPDEISKAIDLALEDGLPSAIVCRTVKGRGASAFEGKRTSHSAALPPELLEQCLRELEDEEAGR